VRRSLPYLGRFINNAFIIAAGGIITRDGDYVVHTFLGSDTLNITYAPNNAVLEYLLVAGGGGSSTSPTSATPGGGAGGLLQGGIIPPVNSYPIVIGAGGAGSPTDGVRGASGSNTTGLGLTAIGGGAAGARDVGVLNHNGLPGGSGGGGSDNTGVGGAGTLGQGYRGGDCPDGISSGGGGGAGGNGANGATNSPGPYSGGNGGAGVNSSITGASEGYAGGGGGGVNGIATHGGGNGGTGFAQPGGNGAANKGGGGGGAFSGVAGNGGSGIVIVRYYNPSPYAGIQSQYEFQNNAVDDVNANDGVEFGDVTYPTAGKFGTYCARFGSFNGRIEIAPLNITGKKNFTVLCWVKTTTAANIAILGFGTEANNRAAFLFLNTSGKTTFDLYGAAGVSGGTSVNDGNWHLVGFENNNGTVNVFVDGVDDAVGVNMAAMDLGNTYATIGTAYSGGGNFDGDMERLSIIPRVLTSAEKLAFYNAGNGLPLPF
jgi:hypothetical protein